MKNDQLTQVIGGSAVGFGVFGLLFPRGLAKAFGVRLASGEFVDVMRLAGAGNLGLGINMVLAGEDERERLLAVSAAVDGLSCAFRRSRRSLRIVVQADVRPLTLTTSSVAALSLLSIRRHRKTTDEQVTSH